jgi:hypothetical protein
MKRKLGKAEPRHDARMLSMSRYLPPAIILPPMVNWGSKIPKWPMMLNDKIGCCTCAAAGHLIEAWTQADAGAEVTISDQEVLSAYEAVGGYNPADPTTDGGAVELDVLNYWRQNGIGGHKITAFGSVNPALMRNVKTAIYLLGGLYIGVSLPLGAQGQNGAWTTNGLAGDDAVRGGWGGHAVPIVGYSTQPDGSVLFNVVTWGQAWTMTQAFMATYCDEAYGILSPDWLGTDGKAPVGFDLATLQSDLKAVTA